MAGWSGGALRAWIGPTTSSPGAGSAHGFHARGPMRQPAAQHHVVDPTLRLEELKPLDALLRRPEHQIWRQPFHCHVGLRGEVGIPREPAGSEVEPGRRQEAVAEGPRGVLERVRHPPVTHRNHEWALSERPCPVAIGVRRAPPTPLRTSAAGRRSSSRRTRQRGQRRSPRRCHPPDRPAARLVRRWREPPVPDLPVVALVVERLTGERLVPDVDRLPEPPEQPLLGDARTAPRRPRNPRDTVVKTRPPDRLSTTENCSAAFIGWTSVRTNVKLPSATRSVSRASSVSSCSGPGKWDSVARWRSGTTTAWKPARSASSPSSIIASMLAAIAALSPAPRRCVSIR